MAVNNAGGVFVIGADSGQCIAFDNKEMKFYFTDKFEERIRFETHNEAKLVVDLLDGLVLLICEISGSSD